MLRNSDAQTENTTLIDSTDSADPADQTDSARLVHRTTSNQSNSDLPRFSTDEERLKALLILGYPNSHQLDVTNILSRTKAFVSNEASDSFLDPIVEDFDEAIDKDIGRSFKGVAGMHWNYWKQIYRTQVRSPIGYAIGTRDGHTPDFIPPWELYKSSEDGLYYHKDDALEEIPIPYDGRQSQYYHVPYSQSPPVPAVNSRRAVIAPPLGLQGRIEWYEIQDSLGDLFSAPPDARIALAFEKNELRMRYRGISLDAYLKAVRILLQSLEKSGSFFIQDYNGVGAVAKYSHESKLEKTNFDTSRIFWRASTAALEKEKNGFIVPPTVVSADELVEAKWLPVGEEVKGPVWESNRGPKDLSRREWCRFICIQGLSNAAPADGEAPDWTLLIYHNKKRPRVPESREPLISRMFNDHLFCRQPKESGNPFESSWRAFHITWNRLLRTSHEFKSTWKKGPLYSNKKYCIQQQAFTVAYFPTFTRVDMDDPRSYKSDDSINYARTSFWTILLLAPESKDEWDEITYGAGSIFRVIVRGLKMTADDWDELRAELGKTIDFESPIWDPELHDGLLSDDEAFSRSRLYFWVVDALGMFHRQIEDTMTEWSRFRTARADMLGVVDKQVKSLVQEAEDQIMRLRELSSYFQGGCKRAETLRSAVSTFSNMVQSL
ncbi:unnamed protein product [Clonostachys byssicola]|uniref:Uncharacterized protein n=1 Tax=Clonostachys byssicola TaxID=160290 RepID=A0A9N9U1S5_9HYPO|nr:unnamed protein product [Clonostachys byssicola]